MKTLEKLIIVSAFFMPFVSCPLFSQEDGACKVLKKELVGEYTGKCKDGLANGKGHAKGLEEYEGTFKNGYPNGNGIYHYADGSVYDGRFSEGLKSGDGVYTFKINGKDSVVNGIWKDDAFVKVKPTRPYDILTQRNVSRYSIIKSAGPEGRVTIFVSRNGLMVNPPDITLMESTGHPLMGQTYYGFENVTFPFTCMVKYTMSNPMSSVTFLVEFEFVIKEPGSWDVKLSH
jgi:hypothetical protein